MNGMLKALLIVLPPWLVGVVGQLTDPANTAPAVAEIVKQVPSLAVLAFVVWMFLQFLAKSQKNADAQLRSFMKGQQDVTREATTAIRESTEAHIRAAGVSQRSIESLEASHKSFLVELKRELDSRAKSE